MANVPIRAIFILKDKPLQGRRKALSLGDADEVMGALRWVPRKASMAKAQEALGEHYKIEIASDGAHPLDIPIPGLRVVHIELTARKAGISFESACRLALAAMRISERDSAGAPLAIALVYPPHAPFGQAAMDSLTLCEQVDWFQSRMTSVILATSCALESLSLSAAARPAPLGTDPQRL